MGPEHSSNNDKIVMQRESDVQASDVQASDVQASFF